MRPRVLVAYLGLLAAFGVGLLVLADRVTGRLVDARFTPLVGPPGTRSVLARPEFRVPVRTNAAGFRGAALPGKKPRDVYRVVVLGDSFTWGYGVRERQAYPARLARRLAARLGAEGRPLRVEVVNLGLPGSGPLDYEWHLEHTALPLAPDLVVVGLFANDVNDLYQVRRFGTRGPLWALPEVRAGETGARPWWKRTAEATLPTLWALGSRTRARFAVTEAQAAGAPSTTLTPVDPAAVVAALGARYERRDALLARWAALPEERRAALVPLLAGVPPGEDMRPVVALAALVDPDAEADGVLLRSPGRKAAQEETGRVLARIVRVARAHGAATLLAVLPAAEQVDRGRWPVLEDAGFRLDPAMLTDTRMADGVRDVARHEGARFVDLLAVFRARGAGGRYFSLDEHWNARGQALAAHALAPAVLGAIERTPR